MTRRKARPPRTPASRPSAESPQNGQSSTAVHVSPLPTTLPSSSAVTNSPLIPTSLNLNATTLVKVAPESSPATSAFHASQPYVASSEDDKVTKTVASETMSTPLLYNLRYKEIAGDGDCLFNAIGFHLNCTAAELRRKVASHMRDNAHEFFPFFSGGEFANFEAYCNKIENTREWGGHIEIEAVKRLTNRPVIIIRSDNNPDLSNADIYPGEPIIIFFNGTNHYNTFEIPEGNTARNIVNTMREDISRGKQIIYRPQNVNFFPEEPVQTAKTIDPSESKSTQTRLLDNDPSQLSPLNDRFSKIVVGSDPTGNPVRLLYDYSLLSPPYNQNYLLPFESEQIFHREQFTIVDEKRRADGGKSNIDFKFLQRVLKTFDQKILDACKNLEAVDEVKSIFPWKEPKSQRVEKIIQLLNEYRYIFFPDKPDYSKPPRSTDDLIKETAIFLERRFFSHGERCASGTLYIDRFGDIFNKRLLKNLFREIKMEILIEMLEKRMKEADNKHGLLCAQKSRLILGKAYVFVDQNNKKMFFSESVVATPSISFDNNTLIPRGQVKEATLEYLQEVVKCAEKLGFCRDERGLFYQHYEYYYIQATKPPLQFINIATDDNIAAWVKEPDIIQNAQGEIENSHNLSAKQKIETPGSMAKFRAS